MNFRQFAINNVLRSKRTYIAHFLSSAFSVMIFFTYGLLSFHPQLKDGLVSSSGTMSMLGTMGMTVSQYIVFVFSFFFLLYSVGAFIKVRKKEFGILLILGMSRKQLNRMLFIENILIGVAAIVAGIGTGMLFSKLILLISAKLLAVDTGLPFYFPLQSLIITAAAYAVLFLLIALFSSFMLRKGTLLALVKAEESPKPQPKASPWLAVLAVLLIGAGYGMVMVFAILQIFNLFLLLGGVVFVIIGTYFLFTQFSVFFMRYLQKKERFFFRRTNLLTISELLYRIKDNAVMFFLVSVISASAFTGIGTTLAIGDPGLSAMENPYAFTYSMYEEDADRGNRHLDIIREELRKSGFDYKEAEVTPIFSDNGVKLIKLSEYNSLIQSLGYPAETLSDLEGILTPGTVTEKNSYRIDGPLNDQFEVLIGKKSETVKVLKAETFIAVPATYGETLVVSDRLYEDAFQAQQDQEYGYAAYHTYYVQDWKNTGDVSRAILDRLKENEDYSYYLKSLYLDWKSAQQQNGILLMVSGLVGIVFFTFAASFVYFRLYADLARDEQQYRMIAKVGLSKKELGTIITKQLVIMFFLPMLIALIHSGVAFVALQQLVDFSIVGHSLKIFIFFLSIQIIYFFITRWRYLERLNKIIQ
ncbi:ABC transporter permease [Virgibacillus sp. LDC1]|uniref:ABC transporter permease n=1 Tax=Paenibacillus TaxID=44249 RepID=UPI002DC03C2C|nr:ABC transporter permease [Paenibacillus lautus]MCV4234380.1 ABC transporter permease [Virgibacillus sp. LDC1]MEC0260127.1 ABC transporter permease [Paenibacillus lautus]MEC0305808.1 ABC transporter permease [Paenibacillus lautus]